MESDEVATEETGAYRVINRTDAGTLNVYVQWRTSSFEILLIASGALPRTGKMSTDETRYYAGELSQSPEEYLRDTREALRGADERVNFALENDSLTWRRGMWTLGKVRTVSVLEARALSEPFRRTLESCVRLESELRSAKAENERLTGDCARLTHDVGRMIDVKRDAEKQLYDRFLRVLNAKKRRIRELEALARDRAGVSCAFDADTDDDDNEGENNSDQRNGGTGQGRDEVRLAPMGISSCEEMEFKAWSG